MKTATKVAAVVLTAVLAAACSQKDPAQKAIDAAEGALAAVHEDAKKYVPEQYDEVKKQLEAARTAFTEEKYGDALNAVKDIPAKAKAVAEAAAAKKKEVLAQLNGDWTSLSSGVPALVSGVEAKLAELGKMKKLPAGLDKAAVDEASGALTGAKADWDAASQAFTAGNLEEAVAKAKQVESAAKGLMAKLGMSPAEPAPAG
jgi:hypothetical protein